MTKEQLLLGLVLLGFVILVGLMAVGWMRRKRRQSDIPEPLAVPATPGRERARFEGFYVSTTLDGQPLNRVAVHDLGFRARVTLVVTDEGVVVTLPAREFFVPAADIREVTRSRYTIDRVVEEGGLVLLAWTIQTTKLDSYFRVEQTQQLVDAIAILVAVPALTPDESERP